MRTINEIVEELFKLLKYLAFAGALVDEEINYVKKLRFEYEAQKGDEHENG